MTFDLAELDYVTACEQPHEFEIKHPTTGAGLGIFVSVIGAESGTFQQYVRAEGNAARKRAFEKRRNGKGDEPMTVEEEEDLALKALATCVRGWRTVIDGKSEPILMWSGRKLECDRENVLTVLRQFRVIREQINEATGDLGNFIGSGSTASSPSPAPSSNSTN